MISYTGVKVEIGMALKKETRVVSDKEKRLSLAFLFPSVYPRETLCTFVQIYLLRYWNDTKMGIAYVFIMGDVTWGTSAMIIEWNTVAIKN